MEIWNREYFVYIVLFLQNVYLKNGKEFLFAKRKEQAFVNHSKFIRKMISFYNKYESVNVPHFSN